MYRSSTVVDTCMKRLRVRPLPQRVMPYSSVLRHLFRSAQGLIFFSQALRIQKLARKLVHHLPISDRMLLVGECAKLKSMEALQQYFTFSCSMMSNNSGSVSSSGLFIAIAHWWGCKAAWCTWKAERARIRKLRALRWCRNYMCSYCRESSRRSWHMFWRQHVLNITYVFSSTSKLQSINLRKEYYRCCTTWNRDMTNPCSHRSSLARNPTPQRRSRDRGSHLSSENRQHDQLLLSCVGTLLQLFGLELAALFTHVRV